jgi:hypothetical protein
MIYACLVRGLVFFYTFVCARLIDRTFTSFDDQKIMMCICFFVEYARSTNESEALKQNTGNSKFLMFILRNSIVL